MDGRKVAERGDRCKPRRETGPGPGATGYWQAPVVNVQSSLTAWPDCFRSSVTR